MGFFEASELPKMENLAAHLNSGLLVRIAQIWLTYRVALALYNISPWHPLYLFPGPRLASMTFLYEFWYDFVCHGRYTRQIQQMHEKYGKISQTHGFFMSFQVANENIERPYRPY